MVKIIAICINQPLRHDDVLRFHWWNMRVTYSLVKALCVRSLFYCFYSIDYKERCLVHVFYYCRGGRKEERHTSRLTRSGSREASGPTFPSGVDRNRPSNGVLRQVYGQVSNSYGIILFLIEMFR